LRGRPPRSLARHDRAAQEEFAAACRWALRALREAREQKPSSDPASKLKAIRRGAEFSFPTANIEQMLREIERGYQA